MQNNDTIKSGDIYCGQERKTGKYFAYQIIDVKKEIMTYLLSVSYTHLTLPTT